MTTIERLCVDSRIIAMSNYKGNLNEYLQMYGQDIPKILYKRDNFGLFVAYLEQLKNLESQGCRSKKDAAQHLCKVIMEKKYHAALSTAIANGHVFDCATKQTEPPKKVYVIGTKEKLQRLAILLRDASDLISEITKTMA